MDDGSAFARFCRSGGRGQPMLAVSFFFKPSSRSHLHRYIPYPINIAFLLQVTLWMDELCLTMDIHILKGRWLWTGLTSFVSRVCIGTVAVVSIPALSESWMSEQKGGPVFQALLVRF